MERWPSGTDARQSVEIPLHKVVTDRASDICLSLPLDMIKYKVNDPKVEYSGGLRERNVGHEPRLEPCLTLLLIGRQKPDSPPPTRQDLTQG